MGLQEKGQKVIFQVVFGHPKVRNACFEKNVGGRTKTRHQLWVIRHAHQESWTLVHEGLPVPGGKQASVSAGAEGRLGVVKKRSATLADAVVQKVGPGDLMDEIAGFIENVRHRHPSGRGHGRAFEANQKFREGDGVAVVFRCVPEVVGPNAA
jgi:hypothetical protein